VEDPVRQSDEGDAQSVAVAGAAGFPLADVLTAIETGALLAMEQANVAKASAEAALAAEKAARASAEASLAAEKEAHAQTQAQLATALGT